MKHFPEANGTLPAYLYRLVDPNASVDLPSPGSIKLSPSDNRELDKLVGALGRNRKIWKRALILYEWLLAIGHKVDDRLCTTLIRVCAQHGKTDKALALYDWMRRPVAENGAGLQCTVYTYTAVMRAALNSNMLDHAIKIWEDAEEHNAGEIDCRLCTTMIEVCSRRGETRRALDLYHRMTAAPKKSKLAPSVHAYTSAMRAATEGGNWEAALSVWKDMHEARCKPTGHAYSAVISACASGGEWRRAVSLFDEMLGSGIKPDVVSCTSLITALGADGQWERAEKVVEWMNANEIRPNVRTYTALVGAFSNACKWEKAVEVVRKMKSSAYGTDIEPNSYTYSALLKALGDHGEWKLAEELFSQIEYEQLIALKAEKSWDNSLESFNFAEDKHVNLWGNSVFGPKQLSNRGNVGNKVSYVDNFDAFDGTETLEEREAAAAVVNRTVELALPNSYEDKSFLDLQESPNDKLSPSLRNDCDDRSENNIVPIPSSGIDLHHFNSTDSDTSQHCVPRSRSSAHVSIPRSSSLVVKNAATQNISVQASLMDNGNQNTTLQKTNGQFLQNGNAKNMAKGRAVVNEVVCGALMMAYEKAGEWQQAVGVLDRAQALGIHPNTIMYNTALSALGKARQIEDARNIFDSMSNRDAVTYETMIAAYGMVGQSREAEELLEEMSNLGFKPQDFAFCGLIAAYSFKGDWHAALNVQIRAEQLGIAPSVHMYNALIAACDRAHQYDRAISLSNEMLKRGVIANGVTRDLISTVCKEGVRAVENQQAAVAALSAAVAAAGTVMMRAGMF